jgi:hypothetical protein
MTRVAVIACGALAADVRRVADRHGWELDVHPLPALLHNRPERIAPAVRTQLERLRSEYDAVAVAYADCGTYGALDAVLDGAPRLAGAHCYDVLDAPGVQAALEEEPGTYLLTDFLARTFEHTVLRQLGLDRHPELRDAYFSHYRRVLWLAQRPTPATRAAAERAAAALGLPLEVREVGDEALDEQLGQLIYQLSLASPFPHPPASSSSAVASPARAWPTTWPARAGATSSSSTRGRCGRPAARRRTRPGWSSSSTRRT